MSLNELAELIRKTKEMLADCEREKDQLKRDLSRLEEELLGELNELGISDW